MLCVCSIPLLALGPLWEHPDNVLNPSVQTDDSSGRGRPKTPWPVRWPLRSCLCLSYTHPAPVHYFLGPRWRANSLGEFGVRTPSDQTHLPPHRVTLEPLRTGYPALWVRFWFSGWCNMWLMIRAITMFQLHNLKFLGPGHARRLPLARTCHGIELFSSLDALGTGKY